MNHLQRTPGYLNFSNVYKIYLQNNDIAKKIFVSTLSLYRMIRVTQIQFPNLPKQVLLSMAIKTYSENLFNFDDYNNILLSLSVKHFHTPEEFKNFFINVGFNQNKKCSISLDKPVARFNSFFEVNPDMENTLGTKKFLEFTHNLESLRGECNNLGLILPFEPEYQIPRRVCL